MIYVMYTCNSHYFFDLSNEVTAGSHFQIDTQSRDLSNRPSMGTHEVNSHIHVIHGSVNHRCTYVYPVMQNFIAIVHHISVNRLPYVHNIELIYNVEEVHAHVENVCTSIRAVLIDSH